jgi:hypothetical protein
MQYESSPLSHIKATTAQTKRSAQAAGHSRHDSGREIIKYGEAARVPHKLTTCPSTSHQGPRCPHTRPTRSIRSSTGITGRYWQYRRTLLLLLLAPPSEAALLGPMPTAQQGSPTRLMQASSSSSQQQPAAANSQQSQQAAAV